MLAERTSIKTTLWMATLTLVAFVLGAIVGSTAVGRATQPARDSHEGQYVTGIGGVFFRVDDPDESRAWYRRHLGLEGAFPGINFFWRERNDPHSFGFTVWSVFPTDTNYFGPNGQQFMIDYRVRDLDSLLTRLRTEGVQQVGGIEEHWYGRFAWIVDGDGNRVELWEPINHSPEEFERQLTSERRDH
jgi:catechol 2,3-dioxygenase-like lactoylglutathione lyase family enzyme